MLLVLQLNNLLQDGGVPPTWEEVVRIGGVAVDEDGAIGTIFLSDGDAVPASAFFLAGIAHHSDGRRYICAWPASNAVHYIGKVAVRSDGAMVIITSGTIVDTSDGWAKTYRGEVFATTNDPEIHIAGIGLLQTGSVCMEEVS